MVAGLSASAIDYTSMLLSSMTQGTSSSGTIAESANAGDFDGIVSVMDDMMEGITPSTEESSSSSNPISESSFGPPAGMEIEGFDYYATEDAASETTETEATASGESEKAGGGGGGGSSEEDEEDSMDLNGDGVVSMDEVMEYLGIATDENSSGSSEISAADIAA